MCTLFGQKCFAINDVVALKIQKKIAIIVLTDYTD